MLRIVKRHYIEASNVFGYRTPKEFTLPDYTEQEHSNRIQNCNLLRLVDAFRQHGHKAANLDPLDMSAIEDVPELHLNRYGFSESDTMKYNLKGILHLTTKNGQGLPKATIKDVYKFLKSRYCGHIAYEFVHAPNPSQIRWFQNAIESLNTPPLSIDDKLQIHSILLKSEVFDLFMHKKFPTLKRYGLQGAESFLVSLFYLLNHANNANMNKVILGTAHRGRLNMLSDLLQYPLDQLFHKIKGNPEFNPIHKGYYHGDVISHLAIDTTINNLQVSLLHNPSHLEAINPVALGVTRAFQLNQLQANCELGDKALCIQVHGDAAFSGQGIIMEGLGISNLPHFSSGGSIHIIINNQIGYTTQAANYRSSLYASDVGKMIGCPIIHVNGDSPQVVYDATRMAFEYRKVFRKDVILDIVCFRRLGHNELDEPMFTNPKMYNKINKRSSAPMLYQQQLIKEGVLNEQQVVALRHAIEQRLETGFQKTYTYPSPSDIPTTNATSPITGVATTVLIDVGLKSVAVNGNTVHPRLQTHFIQDRIHKINNNIIDWATAEAMAIGSLLIDNQGVRMSGQDVGRGTFSQRHLMFVDQTTEAVWIPLNLINPDKQAMLEVVNSSLSEFAVLGFEFGMSWESRGLVIWEAQFGDFNNGAQVIIDTFISSGEAKWCKSSNLVMLLPHGQDGTGPEHSSCKLERFLLLTNDNLKNVVNMHVVNCTTPSQYFHVLRRQMIRNYKKPLIIASPKILLRHPKCVSQLVDLDVGSRFQPVLDDHELLDNNNAIRTLVFCSGKIYYDLIEQRNIRKVTNFAFIRIEELCPFPINEIRELVGRKYKNINKVIWAQEEHANQGAWTFVEPRLRQVLNRDTIDYCGRDVSASVATGVGKYHREEVVQLFEDVFSK